MSEKETNHGQQKAGGSPRQLQIAVVGAGSLGPEPEGVRLGLLAREVGRSLATAGATLLTGGRGGVMEAAGAGASAAGGRVVGILPGADRAASPPNPHVQAAVFTGMGQARNQILVLSADAVIAVGGGWGTLSEIALALKQGRDVVSLESWTPSRPDSSVEPRLHVASDPRGAVAKALRAARRAASDEPAPA